MTAPADNDNHIDGISTMQELDPEPAPRQRLLYVRELILGLLILAGVLGWAGYIWGQDATISSNYAQGQQADVHHDWDSALTYYSAAHGYKAADVRASNAARQVLARNEQYEQARVFQQTGYPAKALQAARAVQSIQPGYAEIDTVVAQAEQQVYSEALSGTIVMRTTADPPGLYYRNATSWVYLPDSDKWSVLVRYLCSDDHIVYDIPAPGWTPPPANATPTPIPAPVSNGRPELKGRRLMQVAVSDLDKGQAPAAPLSFDPADYSYYVCGEVGAWAVNFPTVSSASINVSGNPRLSGGSYVYEAYGSSITSTVTLTGTQGRVVDLGQQGRHALLAAYGEPVNGAVVEQIYLAGPDGSNPRTVYSTTGHIISAQLSPDERYALLIVLDKVSSSTVRVQALLRDAGSATSPAVVATTTLQISTYEFIDSYLQVNFAMSGYFMSQGVFEGKLLLAWPDGNNQVRLRIVDPAKPGQVLKDSSITGHPDSLLLAYEQADGRTLVIQDQRSVDTSENSNKPELAYLHVVEAGTGESVAAISLAATTDYTLTLKALAPQDRLPNLSFPEVMDGSLVYDSQSYNPQAGKQTDTIYSVPLAELSGKSQQPEQLFSVIRSPDAPRGTTPSWYEGPKMLAYTDKAGVLHARLYDSDTNVMLEQGVSTIYGLDTYNHIGILR